MKLSDEKQSIIEKNISTLNGKFKLLKSSSSKLPILSKHVTYSNNTRNNNYHIPSIEEKQLCTGEFGNLSLEKLTSEINKYKQELQKNIEIRDEAKANYEFSKIKAKQREKDVRSKIFLTSQKLNSKDFEILKSQINEISSGISSNIANMDIYAKKEMKNNKLDMKSRLSLKLVEIENKHNHMLNGKLLLNDNKLDEIFRQLKDMEESKESYGKLSKKKEQQEKVNFALKEKIKIKEDLNLVLKAKVSKLSRIMNESNRDIFEQMLAANKKSNLGNFEKMKKIIDNMILHLNEEYCYNNKNNQKKDDKNSLSVSNSYNTSFNNCSRKANKTENKYVNNKIICNKRKNPAGNILKNVNLVYNIGKMQNNCEKKKMLKSIKKDSKTKIEQIEKIKFYKENEQPIQQQLNFTSRKQSQMTNLPILREESLIEMQSQINKNDDKYSEEKSSDNFFQNNNKHSNEVSIEENYKNLKLKDFETQNNQENKINIIYNITNKFSASQNSLSRNNNLIDDQAANQKESELNYNKTSNFSSEKNEITILNLKYLKAATKTNNNMLQTAAEAAANINNINIIEQVEFDGNKNLNKNLFQKIENNIELTKISILLQKATEFLESESFVSLNPRLASTMASLANMLNNLKEKVISMKKNITQNFQISSNKIYGEILNIVRDAKIYKITRGLSENHCLKKHDLNMHKVLEGLTVNNHDCKRFIDAILSNELITKEYETSTFRHVIMKHNIFK